MTKLFLPTILLTFFITTAFGQSGKWSLQFNLGAATENNIGDTGIRTFGKATYAFKNRLNASVGMGSFQMLRSNEQWELLDAYREIRTLSFHHWDLGIGADIIRRQRFVLGATAGATFRVGRQLWPEIRETKNGVTTTNYTFEKIHEIGYTLSFDAGFKVNDQWWLGLNLSSNNYNFIGEYLGASLFAKLHL